jgi:hypothetical protein
MKRAGRGPETTPSAAKREAGAGGRAASPTPLRSFQFLGILGVGLVVAVIALISSTFISRLPRSW